MTAETAAEALLLPLLLETWEEGEETVTGADGEEGSATLLLASREGDEASADESAEVLASAAEAPGRGCLWTPLWDFQIAARWSWEQIQRSGRPVRGWIGCRVGGDGVRMGRWPRKAHDGDRQRNDQAKVIGRSEHGSYRSREASQEGLEHQTTCRRPGTSDPFSWSSFAFNLRPPSMGGNGKPSLGQTQALWDPKSHSQRNSPCSWHLGQTKVPGLGQLGTAQPGVAAMAGKTTQSGMGRGSTQCRQRSTQVGRRGFTNWNSELTKRLLVKIAPLPGAQEDRWPGPDVP